MMKSKRHILFLARVKSFYIRRKDKRAVEKQTFQLFLLVVRNLKFHPDIRKSCLAIVEKLS